MADGGQVSIVNYSALVQSSHSFRFDSDFFRKDYLEIQEKLEKKSTGTLSDYNVSILHPNEIKRTYTDSGVLFLRAQNVRPLRVNTQSNPVFISLEDAELLRKNAVMYKDVLLTRTGANFGQCAIYLEKEKCIASSHTFIIRSGDLNPFFLAVFLNTKFGRKMIDKGMYGAAQPEVAPYFLYKIPVPALDNISPLIEKVYLHSQDLHEQSKLAYQDSQDLLLAELGLRDWKLTHKLTYTKNYSDTVKAGRIDAEYYQPKYDKIIKVIENYKGGYSTIGKEFRQNKTIFQVEEDKLYKYVEIGSVNVLNGEITPEEVLGEDLPANAKRILHKNDVIISKVRTYRGAITIVEKQGYVGSGAFTILAENGRVNKETLLAFIHSKPLLSWSLKPNKGTSYPVIVDDDILNLSVPILPKDKQDEIQQKVTRSFALRESSKQLLAAAKRAVEIAIEKDEPAAIQYLKENTQDTAP